jgi:hypothetical protein
MAGKWAGMAGFSKKAMEKLEQKVTETGNRVVVLAQP